MVHLISTQRITTLSATIIITPTTKIIESTTLRAWRELANSIFLFIFCSLIFFRIKKKNSGQPHCVLSFVWNLSWSNGLLFLFILGSLGILTWNAEKLFLKLLTENILCLWFVYHVRTASLFKHLFMCYVQILFYQD